SRLKNLDLRLIYLLNYALATYSRDFSILEGERSTARQQTLYQQGRMISGAIVTNCDGIIRKSKHQINEIGKVIAVDLLPHPFTGWKDTESFEHLANHIKRCADKFKVKIVWGEDWKMKDMPHFELKE
ncbi:MAG: M15 family metallopeptidase, partial [Fusobacteriaceae bacterium]